MFKVMQQYGTVAQPATVYYCDDEADLQNIKSAPMGGASTGYPHRQYLYRRFYREVLPDVRMVAYD